MRLARAHGLGNDYLVLESGEPMDPALVREICDRHTGVGGDGILEPTAPGEGDYGVRIWNPDGSVAEKSGNGLRIFARWLRDGGAPETFTVWTGFELARCTVGEPLISVEMGRARFAPDQVPVDHELIEREIDLLGGLTLHATALSVGNPHCVVFVDEDPGKVPWRQWGEALETHPWFPNRTNVQIARAIDAQTLEIRIWERGAGPTQASGSSSCAAAAAGVKLGRLLPGRIEVRMPGGILHVDVSPELDCLLVGPVERIATVEVSEAWLLARSDGR